LILLSLTVGPSLQASTAVVHLPLGCLLKQPAYHCLLLPILGVATKTSSLLGPFSAQSFSYPLAFHLEHLVVEVLEFPAPST
jgi:hypothetical protein